MVYVLKYLVPKITNKITFFLNHNIYLYLTKDVEKLHYLANYSAINC